MPMKDRLCGVAALAAVLASRPAAGFGRASGRAPTDDPGIDGDIELVPGIRARAARPHRRPYRVRGREQGSEARAVGRFDARRVYPVPRPEGDHQFRYGL
jgi:hypothetical protein